MKTCPICHARCFDDMQVCFGCMHQFAPDDQPARITVEEVIPTQEEVTAQEDVTEEIEVIEPTQTLEVAAAEQEQGATSTYANVYPGYQLVINLVPYKGTPDTAEQRIHV